MSYEINVLVNGNRCKQYHHDGKIFIEAKEGSEYAIEIKNNTWKRVLTVCSVDGLNILNGEAADEQGPGYVIGQFLNSKFDGFRVSDEKVAKFKFGNKGSGYAESKKDGSEKNVGVIGVRIFSEKEKPKPVVIREDHHHHHYPKYPKYPTPWDSGTPWNPLPGTIWCDATLSGGMTYGCATNSMDEWAGLGDEGNAICSADLNTKSHGAKTKSANEHVKLMMNNVSEKSLRGFDMSTQWGEAKESKVVEVEFERDSIVFSTDIYYASRESLIEMGIPLGNEKQVSFPNSFGNKYAKPPKGWQG